MKVGSRVQPEALDSRIAWMDIARGLAIVLVIAFHSVSEVDKQIGLPSVVVDVNNIVAPARMPLMVFLSGMLMRRSIQRRFADYMWGKNARILWPYFVWSLIMLGVTLAASGINSFRPQSVLAGLTLAPIDHLWFLRDLFLFYLLSYVVQKIPKGRLVLLVGLALMVAGLYAGDQVLRFVYLYFFFSVGWAVASKRCQLEKLVCSNVVLVISTVFATALIPLVLHVGDIRYEVVYLPLVASLAVLVLRLGIFLEGRVMFLELLGRNSLVYYLVHWPVILILAHAIISLAPSINSIVLAAICFAVSFAICSMAMVCCRPGGPLGFIFVFPRRAKAL